MNVKMNDSRIRTIQQVEQFINANNCSFKIESKHEAYKWVEQKLIQFCYITLKKKDKGFVKKYLTMITGYSKSQITRLVFQYAKTGNVRLKNYVRHQPNRKYSWEDIGILAKTDELHNYPSGPSLKTTLKRQVEKFKLKEFENISNISVPYIYCLRKKPRYKKISRYFDQTRPSIVTIGERIKPNPQGNPGYLRVDTVHQGDKDGEKGLYHINTIDEVIQFEILGAVEKISEAYMIPMLELMLASYPFEIVEFHPDNGSEYINYKIAEVLNRLLIKLTKSRPRKHDDNALVEGKNGWVIRKFMGYVHIKQKYAKLVNKFYFDYFNDYLNYHRPCAFATDVIDKKGKIKKMYNLDDYQTPYEKLKSLDDPDQYLKEGFSFKKLDKKAYMYDDNTFAQMMQKERIKLFKTIAMPDLQVKNI